MRENPKSDPAGALRERAGRLRNKAQLITKSYLGRQIDDAWSWLLDTAELCELAAGAMTAENERMRKALRDIAAHHGELNGRAGRPLHRSRTIALAREGLGLPPTIEARINHAAPAAEREG